MTTTDQPAQAERPAPSAGSVRSSNGFDFGAVLPLPPTAARLVDRVQDVAPRIAMVLSGACGRPVGVRCVGAERIGAAQLGPATATWCYADAGQLGRAALVVPPELTVALADAFLGGTGVAPEVSRPGSPLERRLVLRHLQPALQPVVAALSDEGLTRLELGEAQELPPNGSLGDLVTLRLLVSLTPIKDQDEPADPAQVIRLALPARTLLPAGGPSYAAPVAATAAALAEVPVRVSVRLAPTSLSAAEVESLTPGDVVRLDHGVDVPLDVLLDERVLMHATLGRRGRRRAILVTDLVGQL